MSRNTWWGKTLRFIGILLMGITSLFTIAGGAGTTCVALNPTNPGYEGKFDAIASVQWLYILFVVVTVAIGVMAARAVFLLAKGKSNSYRYSIIALISGIVVGGIHVFTSRTLRGSSMPVDGVVYTTVLTLIVFLLFRLPPVWKGVDFNGEGKGDKSGPMAAAITLFVTGLLTLTVQYWAGPTHTWGDTNWAGTFEITRILMGLSQLLGGAGLLILKEKIEITVSKPEAQA